MCTSSFSINRTKYFNSNILLENQLRAYYILIIITEMKDLLSLYNNLFLECSALRDYSLLKRVVSAHLGKYSPYLRTDAPVVSVHIYVIYYICIYSYIIIIIFLLT